MTRLAKNAFPPENKLLLNKWKHKRTGNNSAHFIYFANLNICFEIKNQETFSPDAPNRNLNPVSDWNKFKAAANAVANHSIIIEFSH